MRYEAAFLSADEQARVHEESIRILAGVGIRVHGEVALPLLAEAGAEVDPETRLVKIPPSLVEAALAKAPRSFVYGARNPIHDYAVPSPAPRFAMDGTAAFTRDFSIEKLITMLPSVSAGADIVVGYGELDGDQTLVLEQILVDNEIAHLVLRMVDGVDGREGAELFADIAEIRPGGNFLALQATRKAARSGEFYEPVLIGRASYDAWHVLGKPTIYDRARERVREILDGSVVDPVPDGTLEELAGILAEADLALAA